MWKALFLFLIIVFICYQTWLLTKTRNDKRFLISWLAIVVGFGFSYLFYGLETKDAVEVIPLVVILVLITIVSYSTLKGKESVAGFSSLAILGVSGILYYMIVFLDYEILGTYTLRNIGKYRQDLLEAKADLDSLEHYRNRVKSEVEAVKKEIEVQLEKSAVYTAEAARSNLEMQGHLAKQKEIENIIKNFDKKLSQVAQNLIIFSFLIGEKPLVISGGIVDEFKLDLKQITHSLGNQLKFNSDSLLIYIERRQFELEKEFNKRQEQLQKSREGKN